MCIACSFSEGVQRICKIIKLTPGCLSGLTLSNNLNAIQKF